MPAQQHGKLSAWLSAGGRRRQRPGKHQLSTSQSPRLFTAGGGYQQSWRSVSTQHFMMLVLSPLTEPSFMPGNVQVQSFLQNQAVPCRHVRHMFVTHAHASCMLQNMHDRSLHLTVTLVSCSACGAVGGSPPYCSQSTVPRSTCTAGPVTGAAVAALLKACCRLVPLLGTCFTGSIITQCWLLHTGPFLLQCSFTAHQALRCTPG